MIRLLTKSEIDKAKSQDIQRDRAEGLKIARAVDSLREVHSEEEASLERFRNETLSKIHEETIVKQTELKSLIIQKESLERDVEDLRQKQYQLLQLPIDNEWEKIEDKHRRLQEMEVALKDRLEVLEKEEQKIEIRRKELSQEEARITQEHEASIRDLKDAVSRKESATLLLNGANSKMDEVNQYIESSQKNILIREKEIEKLEEEYRLVKEKQDAREVEQNNRDRQIQDKYETLLRTIKRMK